MWTPEFVDPFRIDRALRSGRRHARVELWSDGALVSSAVPFDQGEVTDQYGSENLGIGVRRSLSLAVKPTRAWLRWLELPSLELRPYTGLWLGKGTLVECPQGRFPILTPERSLPVSAIQWQVDDYYSRVVTAQFGAPVMTPAGRTTDMIAWLLRGAGLPAPIVTSTSTHTAKPVLLDKGDRSAAVVDAAKAISAEVFLDREGRPIIADARVLDEPTGDITALAESVKRTPLWDKVYNVVTAASSNTDAKFGPQLASITWAGHPAFPARLGSKGYPDIRVYTFESPQLLTVAQAKAAADSLLLRVSALAETYTFTGIPDPRIDAGDSVVGPTLDGDKGMQVASVTHPLTQDGRQQITTIAADAELAYNLFF